MTQLAEKIFDFMRSHCPACALSAVLLTLLLAWQAVGIGFKEDITDFLPLDKDYHNAMRVYEEISGGDKVIAIFQLADSTRGDADDVVAAIDDFADLLAETDTARLLSDILYEVDASAIEEVVDFLFEHAPLFLTEDDYARIDSLTSDPDYVTRALRDDKAQLMLPTADVAAVSIRHDPAGLFAPLLQRLRQMESDMTCEMYDGHIFSPDMSRGIAIATSSAGAMESGKNGELADLVAVCADSVMRANPLVEVHLTGGPIIAAGNSGQIKRDCIVSVAISAVLILTLLYVVFGGLRDMLLIGLSIGWGWLFALGGMAILHDEMSIIVLGISSVIIGIAVNYPLHYLSHLGHTPDRRQALREIVTPLVVGNVTTVGAFLALVPLNSVALRDLGLFASLMLVGTIVFVVLYLPHLAKSRGERKEGLLDRLCDRNPEKHPALLWAIVLLTLVFGYFSLQTGFDTDMGNINYMTEQQERDIEYFEAQLSKTGPERKIYAIVSDTTPDGALTQNERLRTTLNQLTTTGKAAHVSYCGDFLCPADVQQERIARWESFKANHWAEIKTAIARAADAEGFTDAAFEPFYALGEEDFSVVPLEDFALLRKSVFTANVSEADGVCSIVSIMDVDENDYDEVKAALSAAGAYAFDVKGMNGAVAERLSDDFNYIGWACGVIVFAFLWGSFGSIELAIISFLPMAVSWLWILGIMAIFGIKFNIVNVILATFIFGQGDDYTIFMTEGASYEHTYRRKMLASYKSSILLSAIIMFFGIGTLIVARHPALRSLAEVTVAGMTSVVLMAYILPPLLFGYLVRGRRAVTLRALAAGVVYRLTGRLIGVKITGDEAVAEDCVLACNSSDPLALRIVRQWDGGRHRIVRSGEVANSVPVNVFGIEEISEGWCFYGGSVVVRVGNVTGCQLGVEHFAEFVVDRYRYKETGVYRAVREGVSSGKIIDRARLCGRGDGHVIADADDFGASALLAALAWPDVKFVAQAENDDVADALKASANDIVQNLEVVVRSV